MCTYVFLEFKCTQWMDINMSRCGAEKAEGAYRLKEPI